MGMVRRKPVITDDNIGKNPLASELIIPVNKLLRKVKNKFGNDDLEEKLLDAVPHCKVFEVAGYKKNMYGLSIRSKELLLWIIHNIEGALDYIWIDRVEYMKLNKIRASSDALISPRNFALLFAAPRSSIAMYMSPANVHRTACLPRAHRPPALAS